jgi:hypothetical protein
MAETTLVDDVVDLCDIDPVVCRRAVEEALLRSGHSGKVPSLGDIRRALPELRRLLEEVIAPAQAYEATERVDLLLDERVVQQKPATEPETLAQVTARLRESNRAMSSRDFAGEVADMEAEMIVRRQRRSFIPPSK